MTNIQRGLLLILVSGIVITESCKKNSDEESQPTPAPTPTPVVMTARDSAIEDYNVNYMGSAITTASWTGTTSSCTPGTISQNAHTATIKRINYFRKLVGLN